MNTRECAAAVERRWREQLEQQRGGGCMLAADCWLHLPTQGSRESVDGETARLFTN